MEPVDPQLVKDLACREAYPEDAGWDGPVEVIQTHLSTVFLARDRVAKLRKSVDLGFVDFSTRARRNQDCLSELRLNRRLAPDVYLGVAPLRREDGRYRLGPLGEALAGPDGEAPEHVVVMRRLPDGADALSLLERGAFGEAEADAVARRLARFHAQVGLGRPGPYEPEAWRRRCWDPVEACLESLAEGETLPAERMAELTASARERFAKLAPALERRRAEGRAVAGHGDVHLQHVWLEPGAGEPILVDCVEFDEGLRHIDAASEVAFLAMDLGYRGHAELGERFLWRYAEATDDWGLYEAVDFFVAYRALVRGKVADLATRDAAIAAPQREAARQSALRHVALAEEALAQPSPGRIVVVCGHVGAGKSSVARGLVGGLRGVVLATDRLRRHLEAEEMGAAVAPDRGRYSPARRSAVYAAMLERASAVLASGRSVLLDATYEQRAERERVLAFATRQGAEAWLVRVHCDPEVARVRLRRRSREGADPSEAGEEQLDASLARFEAPDEWPAGRLVEVDTSDEGWREALRRSPLARVPGAGGERPA